MNAPESADEILFRAAEAAIQILPQVEREAAEHIDKANKLQLRATQLKALVSAAGLTIDHAPQQRIPKRQDDLPLGLKPARGKVKKYIDDILAETPRITEGEIRAAMLNKFQIECGRSTLYSNLASGKEDGRYNVEDSKWFLR